MMLRNKLDVVRDQVPDKQNYRDVELLISDCHERVQRRSRPDEVVKRVIILRSKLFSSAFNGLKSCLKLNKLECAVDCSIRVDIERAAWTLL